MGATLVHRSQGLRLVDLMTIIKEVLLQQRKVTYHRRLVPCMQNIHGNTKIIYENPTHHLEGQEP